LTEEKHDIQISDQDISSDDQNLKTDQVNKRHMERRQVLRLGVAGMPMMLSMRASAQSFANSALDCTITIPADLSILVHRDGRAWVTDRVNIGNGRLTNRRVRRIQRRAQYFFPSGTVPDQYRETTCTDVSNFFLCQFALYTYRGGLTFEPGRLVNASGDFTISGTTGLYLALTVRSTDSDGRGRMPGASCVISILDYVNQQ
jgi:hypothetical protein